MGRTGVVHVFQTMHLSLGRWYWFVLGTLSLITLHTIDHTSALFTNNSPIGDAIIGAENTQTFVLYHGGLTIADYFMTVLLLTLLYRRSASPSLPLVEHPFRRPAEVLKRLHRIMRGWYWFFFAAIIPITFHAGDHAIFMLLGTSPLSDTIVAQQFSQLGFLLWHSILTILDFALSVVLIRMIYVQWTATHRDQTAPRMSLSTPID